MGRRRGVHVAHVDGAHKHETRLVTFDSLYCVKHFHGTLVINSFRTLRSTLPSSAGREYDDVMPGECLSKVCDWCVLQG